MVAIREYLREGFEEPVPDWLCRGDFTLENFFRSRTIFYPGAGEDGHAIATFNASRTAYCFVYADYRYDSPSSFPHLAFPESRIKVPGDIPSDLRSGYQWLCLRGYRWLCLERLNPESFQARRNLGRDRTIWIDPLKGEAIQPFALLAIYERLPGFGDDHGGKRIAVLFVRAEANRLYRRLYTQLFPDNPPFAVLLQDHAGGGNPVDLRFCNPYGPMAREVRGFGRRPRFLLIGEGGTDEIWSSYVMAECEHEFGGVWANERVLYESVDGDGVSV